MDKPLPQVLREMGVVGAGGAGFPTYVKIDAAPEVVIANGAECEPLLRVDRQLMETQAQKIVAGMRLVLNHTGAKRGVMCIKEKYHKAHDALKEAIGDDKTITVQTVGNYYPAGDEQTMVYEVTGKAVPTGGLPIDCGALVQNVGTLINIAQAAGTDSALGKPVTHRILTVTGEVKTPVTLKAPLGAAYADCVRAAGGPSDPSGYALIIGGPAMGFVEEDWSKPVTKTTGGIIVLKREHYLIAKKTSDLEREAVLARAACCQCNYCTYLCPRNALGLNVEPHKVMRAIGYGDMSLLGEANGIFSCCDCGICTHFACNFGLNPSRFMTQAKQRLMSEGKRPRKENKYPVNKQVEYLRVPAKRFLQRLDVGRYDVEAPLSDEPLKVQSVKILLKQHIGVPAAPVIAAGERVSEGQVIAAAPEGKLSVNIHASVTGIVTAVTEQHIEIAAEGGVR